MLIADFIIIDVNIKSFIKIKCIMNFVFPTRIHLKNKMCIIEITSRDANIIIQIISSYNIQLFDL